MTDSPAPAPPPTAPKTRGPAFWLFACCGGCALFALIPLLLGVIAFFQVRSAYFEGKEATVQERTYEATIPNVGLPPGYRILWANTVPYLKIPVVAFVPEATKGDVFDFAEDPRTTVAILTRAHEDESQRASRDRMFDDPKSMPFTAIPFVQSETVHNVRSGTIPGHLFPLRYFTATVGDSRRNGRATLAVAMVDLTPARAEESTVLVIRAPSMDEITYEFLVEFCRNFKPGE